MTLCRPHVTSLRFQPADPNTDKSSRPGAYSPAKAKSLNAAIEGFPPRSARWTCPGPRLVLLAMADESLYDRIHDLTDLELAALLSLINREHCLISTPQHAIHDLVAELQLVRLAHIPWTAIEIFH